MMSAQKFVCPEETAFYSRCLSRFMRYDCQTDEFLVELGSGDGSPMIKALRETGFQAKVFGFEINEAACRCANELSQQHQLEKQYIIYCRDFFDKHAALQGKTLVSNPPYLPAPEAKGLYLPELYGGSDGTMITRRLLSLGYENLLLIISSYSNPEGLINYAETQGYRVSRFWTTMIPFGRYSLQPQVKKQIEALRRQHRAFYLENTYLLAGVVFSGTDGRKQNRSNTLLATIRNLDGSSHHDIDQ
jgi:methylase of polypeptide subunit release factors